LEQEQKLKAELHSELLRDIKVDSIPVGTIWAFAGDTAPDRWLICDGQAVPHDQTNKYYQLARLLGTKYSPPNNNAPHLPDLCGRTIIGVGQGNNNNITQRNLGAQGGEEQHTLTVPEMPAHNHGGQTGPINSGQPVWHDYPYQNRFQNGGDTGAQQKNVSHTHSIPTEGDGRPHNNMPPFLVLNYIIKY